MKSIRDLAVGTRKLCKSRGTEPAPLPPVSKIRFARTVKNGQLIHRARCPSSQKGEYKAYMTFRARPAEKGLRVPTRKGVKIVRKPRASEPVKVRCDCPDYQFSFWQANEKHDCHFGKGFPRVKVSGVRDPRNPKQIPGLCKHLRALGKRLQDKHVLV